MKQKIIILIMMSAIIISVIYLVNSIDDSNVSGYQEVEYLIGMSHPNLTDEWQIVIHEELEEYSQGYDRIKMIFTNAGSSSYKQINDIDKLLEYGIDLLIITVNDANVLGPIIDEVEKKIPVIVLDKDIGFNDYTLFIGPDYNSVGQMGAQRLKDLAGEDMINIVTLNGPIEDPMVREISKGFSDMVNRELNMNITENIYCGWLRTEAEKEFELFIQSNQEFDVVFAQSNALAIGAGNILKEHGMDVPIITVSKFMEDKYLTYLDIGELNTIIYTPVGGKEAIDYAMEILESNRTNLHIPKRIVMKSFSVTKQNKSIYTESSERRQTLEVGYIQTHLYNEENLSMTINNDIQVVNNAYENIGFRYYDIDEDQSAREKDQLQKHYFMELLNQGVDIIFFSPENSFGWEELTKLAKSKNTYVVCLGNPLEYEDTNVIYIGPDYIDQGIRLSNYLINNVYNIHYDIGILEVTGDLNTRLTVEKSSSFRQQISGYSRINIIDSIEGYQGHYQQEELPKQMLQLKEKMKQSFTKYSNDINVVYLHQDYYINPLKEVIKELNLDQEIVVISNNDSGIANKDSELDYQVYPDSLYKDQIIMLLDYFMGRTQIPIEKIYLPNAG